MLSSQTSLQGAPAVENLGAQSTPSTTPIASASVQPTLKTMAGNSSSEMESFTRNVQPIAEQLPLFV